MAQRTRTVLVALAYVFGGQRAAPAQQAPEDFRRLLPGTFVTVATSTPDTSAALQRPSLLAHDGQLAYTYDYGDSKLKAFDRNGRLQWAVGGISIFSNPTDLQVASNGEIWLLDAPRRRLTVFDRSGRTIRTLQLTKGVERFVPKVDGGFVGLQIEGADVAGYHFGRDGRVISPIELPSYLRPVPSMARSLLAAPLANSSAYVTVHHYSDHVALWKGSQVAGEVRRGVEPVPFARLMQWTLPNGATVTRIAPSATQAARSVTADSADIYVLFAGAGPRAGRLVDVYSAETGRYRGTYLLPRKAAKIAKTRDGFVVLVGGNSPSLEWLRLQGKRRAGRS